MNPRASSAERLARTRQSWVLAVMMTLGTAIGCSGGPAPAPGPEGAPGVLRTGERIHVVRRGETYSSIARLYGVPVDTVRRANPGVAPERLAIGSELRIPSRKPEVRNVERTDAP